MALELVIADGRQRDASRPTTVDSDVLALERTVGELLDRCEPLLAATGADELRGLVARMCTVDQGDGTCGSLCLYASVLLRR